MPDPKKYTCQRCHKEYLHKEIRLSGYNKYTCIFCLGQPQQVPEEPKPSVKEDLKEYHCNHCNYSFSRKQSVQVLVCPYCGRSQGLTLKKEKTAADLLDESTDDTFL